MAFTAFAAHAPRSPLTEWTYEPGEMPPFAAEVAVTHCGVCHSDLHIINGDWGGDFPVVCGHEVVGEVVGLGSAADPSLLGKRVGIGWQSGACLACEECLAGQENLCRSSRATCFRGGYGGFARHLRVDSRFCHILPEALSSEAAAPLLCAGITVYAPLARYARGGLWRVGVAGIGGLGHLGVRFAAAMGAHVTAFTTSPAKAEEAARLGAARSVVTTAPEALRQARSQLDFLLVTVNVPLDWEAYARTLRPNGVLCYVGAVDDRVNIPIDMLVGRQLVVTGGSIGSRGEMRAMLQMAAQHQIIPWTETLPFSQINTAMQRLAANDVRYRFVLAW